MKKALIDILVISEIHKKFLALLPDKPNLLGLDNDGALSNLQKSLPLKDTDLYDGIWASGALIQSSKAEINALLQIIYSALIPGGYFFCTFKYGHEQEIQTKKAHNLYDEISFSNLLAQKQDFAITKLWRRRNSSYKKSRKLDWSDKFATNNF
ncbi:MAG: hypothetical protein WC127_05350 [Acidaminococcaceae bacterium]